MPQKGRRARRQRSETRIQKLKRLVRSMPARIGARRDLRRPELARGYGVLNGQAGRQAAVSGMFQHIDFDLVVETGTYRGTTTEFLRTLTRAPIVTIEVDERLAFYSQARLQTLPDVRVVHGDSATEIRRLVFGRGRYSRLPFCYLDAHWHARLPLRWEILEVLSAFPECCILIDDFQVPTDAGYRFDDYGRGFRLTPDLLDGLDLHDVEWFWPAVPATQETGYKRGWLVLARGETVVTVLRAIPELRQA